jgi:hypothetical protein
VTAEELKEFATSQIFGMTLGATAQRTGMYVKGQTEADRRPFQCALRSYLEAKAIDYKICISEEVHVSNISDLAKNLSESFPTVLVDSRMRIGLAQKALNLYLKYLWCFGQIAEPPHCPIDARILRRLPGFNRVRWTRLDQIDEYMSIVNSVRTEASAIDISIAVWELQTYNVAARYPLAQPDF